MSEPSEALRLLKLIDRLEVGPPRIEPRRVVAPYTVWQNGRADTRELAYRFGEDVFFEGDVFSEDDVFGREGVFGPGCASSQNLAALMVAQVAVNYGLFCEEIVFRGAFEPIDREFLAEMAAVCARDIYARKLLRPKPFFTSWVEQIPTVVLPSYLLARLTFPDAPAPAASPWRTDEGRFALLSSGGKDSLVSYQLLAECGRETHPVFVNEAGKHWFTARNAYRHFTAEVPHTARVWTSSDRLFAWMLRHLPFVSPDWARHGWPGYPIRVWTVPVFLFGVLPLLRRRGVGRLVVGNEYDTTAGGCEAGIAHRFCLYDQSRPFDHRLRDYFRRKGWGIEVLSLLRPLSGLLIQKILLERYPQTLGLQMSCHRAHPGGDRMLPCGTCEKCLGVMTALVAFGRDPAACGYTSAQVERCLAKLPHRGPWLERAALAHLGFLLHRQGLLPAAQVGGVAAEEHAEVLKLRFDGEASALDDLPADLRRPLFEKLLAHAEGAVEAVDDEWMDFDLLGRETAACPDPASPST